MMGATLAWNKPEHQDAPGAEPKPSMRLLRNVARPSSFDFLDAV